MEARAAEKGAREITDLASEAPTLTSTAIEDIEIANQEHLQLTLEEAFFLTYALGSLKITNAKIPSTTTADAKTNWHLLQLFRRHSFFPPLILHTHTRTRDR